MHTQEVRTTRNVAHMLTEFKLNALVFWISNWRWGEHIALDHVIVYIHRIWLTHVQFGTTNLVSPHIMSLHWLHGLLATIYWFQCRDYLLHWDLRVQYMCVETLKTSLYHTCMFVWSKWKTLEVALSCIPWHLIGRHLLVFDINSTR